MTIRSILQDVRDGIGSLSRRRSDASLPYNLRSRSLSAVTDESQFRATAGWVQGVGGGGGRWASLPPELLRDVLQRVECTERSWPARRTIVACAGVCTSWRRITQELVVHTLQQSGHLTFPTSLKQPGPKDCTIQCFIKRDGTTSTYHLFLGLNPTLSDHGKFLLAARRVRRPTSTDYIISLDPNDMSRGSHTYVGKLRSNFLGTKFSVFESQGGGRGSRRRATGGYHTARVGYELNVLGTRGPRRMHCTVQPWSSSAPSLASLPSFGFKSTASMPMLEESVSYDDDPFFLGGGDPSSSSFSHPALPVELRNKAPRWHEQLQCWCLNFRGRVTVASVKNFQLVAVTPAPLPSNDPDPLPPVPPLSPSEPEPVLLQFGKVGKDLFTMDYQHPLSAFQAFAICLSSFDTKLACE